MIRVLSVFSGGLSLQGTEARGMASTGQEGSLAATAPPQAHFEKSLAQGWGREPERGTVL